ncbi:PREDICTED: E3 ubiquitin/ISG15 ligase TRIM25-like [Nanorana parkeri]|uniref:E3 ubiquitin/ISG15 ligase TRIM25-like n=1 Tax=Nanorana parkeri TaxID=125878 RepID=UPI000855099E|nr:PREDICTED: E3 ubiquitin/ISG15 ligase TRIM25-like [Nanorana parkeri]
MTATDLREELSCSICLERYMDPVSLQCGHNFCQHCIKSALDAQEQSGIYTCPECRAEYPDRPQPEKNRKLCNIVECYLMAHLEEDPEETKILCTYCDFVEPAVKMCLQCETYFCSRHLNHHNNSVNHFLLDPTTSLENIQCPTHNKMLKYYCFQDESCVCVSCFATGDHRGHVVQPIYEVSEVKTKEIRHVLETLTSGKSEMEKGLQTTRYHLEKVQKNADSITQRVNGFFEDIQEQLNSLKKRILGELNRQTEEARSQVSDLIKQMEVKSDKMTRRINHIQDICNNQDPFYILQGHKLARDVFETVSGADKTSHLIDLNEGLVSNILHTGLVDILTSVKKYVYVGNVSTLLMDASTAHNKMELSADLKTVADSDTNHGRPGSPLRFVVYNQVLSVNAYTEGQHYWEVETSKTGIWDIGLAYPSIERDGKPSGIGDNDKSWCLRKYTKKYMAAHNSKAQSLLHEQCSQVIGMYLDYEAGRLSFYELLHPSRCLYRHIYTFTATFTEPMHAAVYVDDGGWVTFKHK